MYKMKYFTFAAVKQSGSNKDSMKTSHAATQ